MSLLDLLTRTPAKPRAPDYRRRLARVYFVTVAFALGCIRLKGDGAQSKITEGERIERVFPIARAKGEDIGGGVRSQKSAQSARVSEGLAGLFGEGVSEL